MNASGSALASSAINNRYSYTGREWDATVGLYHFRARWMSPKSGRFLSRDPIGYEGSKWGLYHLFQGLATNSLDPTGESRIVCDCSCEEYTDKDGVRIPGGEKTDTQITVECQGLADSCCSSACESDASHEVPGGSCNYFKCSFTGSWVREGTTQPEFPPIPCSKVECRTGCAIAGVSANLACDQIPEARLRSICKYAAGMMVIGCVVACESCELD
ncbi:MAG: RHS repeat domain-containing protein [Pirellula sp.]